MITLLGHGYIGTAIAAEWRRAGIPFVWCRHDEAWPAYDNVIVNASGFTGAPNVDSCETKRLECIDGNISWRLEVERRAGTTPVIHLGTGCIYLNGPHREEDEPNFTGSFYSLCNVAAERALRPYLRKSYLLRVRLPFSNIDEPRNLLSKLVKYPRLINHHNSLSCVADIAKVITWFALNLPKPGVYNCTNPGSISTREIVDMLGLNKMWFGSEEEFLATVVAPRSHCILDTSKLESIFPMRPIRQALNDCIRIINAHKLEAFTPAK